MREEFCSLWHAKCRALEESRSLIDCIERIRVCWARISPLAAGTRGIDFHGARQLCVPSGCDVLSAGDLHEVLEARLVQVHRDEPEERGQEIKCVRLQTAVAENLHEHCRTGADAELPPLKLDCCQSLELHSFGFNTDYCTARARVLSSKRKNY